ncbi:hypothetical protein QTP88_026860 [Uroleucon formosanum]
MLHLKTTLANVLPNSKLSRLKSVYEYETRWVERHDAILQFLELYDIIINCLDELGNSNEETTVTTSKANNLLNCMLKFEFLITLQVLAELFPITLPLSKQLQNQNLEYFQSLQMVNTILEEFENKRKNSIQSFNSIYTKSLISADMYKIEMESTEDFTKKSQDFDIQSSDQQDSDVSFAFTRESSSSGSANLPDISTETINNNESNQFKNKNPEPPENQFDCFGKSVATQLKTLPYDQALIAQSKIQNILSDMAIENYKYCSTPGPINSSSSSEFRTQTPVTENRDLIATAFSMTFEDNY